MPIAYQFLPWVRRGLAVALESADTLGAGALLEARGSAHVGVTLAGAHAGTAISPVPMRLHGPGDVIGIDQRLVVRTDPRPHARNFEPNYLAIIDFDPPDFPWMLTPAKAQGERLRPWLVLIVVDQSKTGLPRMTTGAPLPSIRIKAGDVATELPDLSESWSWAHSQLVNDNVAQIQADLQSKPNSNISRLVCPRRLKELTDYVACVVPAFEPGRLRGLGKVTNENDPAMTSLGPAWNKNAAADVVLPVYHFWEFSTSPKGDFESLARRLRTPGSYAGTRIEQQLKEVGTIPMSVDNLLNGITPGLVTTMEGALVPISYEPGTPPPVVQAQSLEIIVNTPQDQVVNPVGDGADNADGRRLEVKPPLYGAWHAKKHQVFRPGVGPATAPKLGSHWLADLNLNPRYRGAAGYGAEVVRRNQEDYVDACWDQIGDIQAAEMAFNLTRLSIEALTALKRKHYDVLPPERLMQIFGPALPRIEALGAAAQTYRIKGQIASIGGQLARSSLPTAIVDTAMRRVASPANRSLRMAARLNRTTAALPAVLTSYVRTMALATKRSAAFTVNGFMPDGIMGTKLFDRLDLRGAATTPIDLSAIGLPGAPFTVGDVTQTLASAQVAQRALTTSGVPELTARDQSLGVITDLHAERFGMLLSNSTSVRVSDWSSGLSRIEALTRPGIEGFLLEAGRGTTALQVHALQLDGQTGQLTLNRIVAVQRAGTAVAATTLNVGRINTSAVQRVNAAGLIAMIPPNTLSSAGSTAAQTFTLNQNLEWQVRPAGTAAATSVTVPAAILDREVLKRFATGTRGAQATWADAFAAKRVTIQVIDFPLASAATVVRARTEPALTLPLRLASTVSIAKSAASASTNIAAFLPQQARLTHRFMIPKLFDRVMAWPHLRNAFYRELAVYDKNAFMPGVDNLPQDLIMLVQVNQYFIDAVMAGANYEMNRELLWRGFPTDLRGTPFQRFWGRFRVKGAMEIELLDDMEPIHQWRSQPLGKRTDENMPDPDRIALLVRGQLLRRYPNTAVYAWKKRTTPANPGDTQLMKDPDGLPSNGAIQTPVFSGFIEPDITFFGFEIDKGDVDDWCFVLEEQMSEPRFGFDVDVKPEGQPLGTAQPRRSALETAITQMRTPGNQLLTSGYNAYKALSWTHVQVAAGEFATLTKLINVPDKPFASFPTLTANASAADIAKALLQEPFRAYYLGSDLAT